MYKKLFIVLGLSVCLLTACGDSEEKTTGKTNDSAKATVTEAAEETEDVSESEEGADTEETVKEQTVFELVEQGNPTTIALADIVEEASDGTYKAWLKVSTLYDEDLSVYLSSTVPADTEGFVVDFKVTDFDAESSTLYWCYQLDAGGETLSVWDTSSAADQFTITEGGTYRMVLNAQTAFGTTIDSIESLQIVIPNLSETTTTTVEFLGAKAITSAEELAAYATGAA